MAIGEEDTGRRTSMWALFIPPPGGAESQRCMQNLLSWCITNALCGLRLCGWRMISYTLGLAGLLEEFQKIIFLLVFIFISPWFICHYFTCFSQKFIACLY